MPRLLFLTLSALAICGSTTPGARAADGYCAVVSRATYADPSWRRVADALIEKHHGRAITYDRSVDEAAAELKRASPKYIAFVATPAEASREFVVQVNRLLRRVDDAPYGSAIWGIVTGYDAAGALRIARHKEPLVIHRVAAGTDVELSLCDEGLWYCELNQGKMVRKQPGKKPETLPGPADTTQALVDALATYHAQLFVTSGHATERGWQIGYRYRNGQFRSQRGQLFGLDTAGRRIDVHSDNPKVFLPVGNCLMGHIDGPDAMALAFMNSAGVYQMAGYTVPTWYGYGGWGLLDYFVEQPGRFTAAEAFFANQQALVHRLQTFFPAAADERQPSPALSPQARAAGLTANDAQGLLYDRDNLVFYGDPAWEARMAPGPLAWEQSLTVNDGTYTFDLRPRLGARSFQPLNTNGSQRGGRPFLAFLPERISSQGIKILAGAELSPVVTSRFLLVPNPSKCDPGRTYRVVFRTEQTAASDAGGKFSSR